eukprot:2933601-Rhodomonas_salina.1
MLVPAAPQPAQIGMAGLWGYEQGCCRVACPECFARDRRTARGNRDLWVFRPFDHPRRGVPRPQFETTLVD